jgi:hypothetical protein
MAATARLTAVRSISSIGFPCRTPMIKITATSDRAYSQRFSQAVQALLEVFSSSTDWIISAM